VKIDEENARTDDRRQTTAFSIANLTPWICSDNTF